MKFKTILLIFLSPVFLLNAKCKKDKINPPAVLPAITQEGKNTFGCKVNGEVWVPYYKCGGTGNPCGELIVDIARLSQNVLPTAIHIGAAIKYKDNTISSLSINSPINTGVNNTGNKIDSVELEYVKPGVIQYFEGNGSGFQNTFTITKLDTINKIIAGTFEATLYRSLTDSIRITEGRFDLKFQVCKCSN